MQQKRVDCTKQRHKPLIWKILQTKIRSTERIFSHYYFTLMELLLKVDCPFNLLLCVWCAVTCHPLALLVIMAVHHRYDNSVKGVKRDCFAKNVHVLFLAVTTQKPVNVSIVYGVDYLGVFGMNSTYGPVHCHGDCSSYE